jgi:two-component system cell cycle sensor histidine kinase/response regulator CckA
MIAKSSSSPPNLPPENGEAIRILLLEHCAPDVELCLQELDRAGIVFEAAVAASREEFLALIRAKPFDVVLSDYRFPEWTGMEALEALQNSGKDIPFLLVTGTLGEEAAVECIKRGVHDYILKGHLSRLPSAVQRASKEKSLRDERTRAAEALKESEARAREQFAELEQLYRTAPIGLALVDQNLNYVRVNEAFAAMNGIPAEEHIGRQLRKIIPDAAATVEPLYHQVLESGMPLIGIEIQTAIQAQPGVVRDFLVSYYPLLGEDGTPRGVNTIVLDVTERKHTELELRRSDARNRELIDNAIYGILRARATGELLEVNPALVRMLGYDSREDLLCRNLLEDVHRYPQQRAALLKECDRTGRVESAEVEWKRKDGTSITVRVSGRSVPVENQESVSYELFAEDVTQIRAMENQIRRIQKFEAIGQLAGGIAHDFNNVIGAIHGWAEIGVDQPGSSPAAYDHFRKIRDQAERAAGLTRQLLAFARRQVLEPRDISLNQTVETVLTFVEKVIGSNIELRVSLASELPTVLADASQVEQVLMNLCLNARDAMPDGGRLAIETAMVELDAEYCRYHSYALPGRYIALNVSDNGIGMDAATRERIFEPFFTTKELGKGTGLGLATVYGIVKQHNGFVQVYSEPGVGSTFRVYLPVGTTQAKATETPPARDTTPVPHGQEVILIAEDHEGVRTMALETLEGFGYRVVVARDGEEALHMFEERSGEIALVVLDVVMPRLGGPALYNKLKVMKPRLAVIFTTGYLGEIAALEPLLAGGAALLQKPYSPASLGRRVREVLDAAAKAVRESSPAAAGNN